jgi:phosphatidylinositol alpha-1,6-mannosyltransferase
MRHAITHAELIIAAGTYPARETRKIGGRKTPKTVIVPPGVDINRFYPLLGNERLVARARFGIAPESIAVVAVSRLVPRKGMDILIEACSALLSQHPSLELVIGGTGRDRERLGAIAQRLGVPVTFLGRVEDNDLPALYAGADLAAMLCRNRWLGLEQEGFGIVFLEAAAAGVASIAGASGGAPEAVLDGITGRVVSRPQRVKEAIAALDELISDPARRERYGAAARDRVENEFDYDVLASQLDRALLGVEQ